MATALKTKPGINGANVLSIPTEWDATWFRKFINNSLKGADVRNAVGTGGIKVTGNISSPYATIDGSGIASGVTQIISGPGISISPPGGTGAVTITNAAATQSVVGTANEIAVSTAAGVSTLRFSPNIIIPAPPSGVPLTIDIGTSTAENLHLTNVDGSYIQFDAASGTLSGYLGSSINIAGFGNTTDFGIRANANIYFFPNGIVSPAMSLLTTGQVTINQPNSATNGLSVTTVSDDQIRANAASGGRFSTVGFNNNGVSKTQLYWDNVAATFNINTVGLGPVNVSATALNLNGVSVAPTTGTFTATYVGGTTAPTVTCAYTINGKSVTIYIPAISATSNSTSFSLSGVPAAITPGVLKDCTTDYFFTNNGAAMQLCAVSMSSTSTILFTTSTGGPVARGTGWNAAGTKASPALSFSYDLT